MIPRSLRSPIDGIFGASKRDAAMLAPMEIK